MSIPIDSRVNPARGVLIHMDKMTFPNFLKVTEWDGQTYPVALLTDEQASAFWDEQKPKWLAHVAAKRAAAKQQDSEVAKP